MNVAFLYYDHHKTYMGNKTKVNKGGVSNALLHKTPVIESLSKPKINHTNKTLILPTHTKKYVQKEVFKFRSYTPHNLSVLLPPPIKPALRTLSKKTHKMFKHVENNFFKIEIYNMPPKNPNNLIITLNCDDVENEECCKYNEHFCEIIDVDMFRKILKVIKEIVNKVIGEYIDFFNIPNILGFDIVSIKVAVLVTYIIEHILTDLKIDNPIVHTIISTLASTYFTTFIMLPKHEQTMVNYFVKVIIKNINKSVKLITLKSLITSHLISELERLK